MSDDLPPTTWEGGHALVIEYGDCEFYARCQCYVLFGSARPDQGWDQFGREWEKHVNTNHEIDNVGRLKSCPAHPGHAPFLAAYACPWCTITNLRAGLRTVTPEQQCPGVPRRGHTNLTEEQPTIMQGLNRILGRAAESWLVEHGFVTPGPEDEND